MIKPNKNSKFLMKIEDSEETINIFEDRRKKKTIFSKILSFFKR